MNWENWKSKIQSIDVSSAIGSLKENTSSAVSLIKNISSSEPQQYIEAEQLGIYYITNNVIAMGYPSQESLFSGTSIENMSSKHSTLNKLTKFVSDSMANKIAKYLNKYHSQHYMIWNLSERSYPTDIFNDQVIEFKFPGYPSPPLQQLFQLLSSIDNWLCSTPNDDQSGQENVAIIHCQTGKGRTVTVISAYLAWSKYNNFTPAKALLHTVKIMNGTIKNMTIPSQTRYLAYLTKILINKQIPKTNPLMIQRVIVHQIPIFEVNQQTFIIKNKHKKKKIMEKNQNNQDQEQEEKKKQSPSLLQQPINKHEAQFMIGSIDDDDDDDDNDDNLELGQNIEQQQQKEKEEEEEEQQQQEKEEKEDINNNNNNNNNNVCDEEEEEMEVTTSSKTVSRSGVRPYIQIFKNAKLIFSSRRKNSRLKFYDTSDGHIKFEVNREIEGDVLVRIRHLCNDGTNKISVCRFAFHTGYLEQKGVIRFKKTQLDGAWNSNKFNKDFWIDLLIGDANTNQTPQRTISAEFWADITKRCSKALINPIDIKDRYSIIDDINTKDMNIDHDNNTNNNDEWKGLLKEWNLGEYIDNFGKRNITENSLEEWRNLTKTDLIEIGLTEVDAQIFLNMSDNPHNVANLNNNDIDLIKNKIDIKNENEQNLLKTMDDSSKEVIQSMTDLMTKEEEEEEEEQNEEEQEQQNEEQEEEELNAEEHSEQTTNSTIKSKAGSKTGSKTGSKEQSIDTFGDLEEFADGLDLENVEVDSDTEQNFEMLLEELNDDTVHEKTKNDENNGVDLP